MVIEAGRKAKNFRSLRTLFPLGAAILVFLWGVVMVCRVGGESLAADTSPADGSRLAAEALQSKLQVLSSTAPEGSRTFRPVVITEQEANAYLKFHAHEFLPAGVHDATIRITPDRILGAAEVDFGEFSRAYPNPSDWGPKVLAAMFKGPQHVTAASTVQSQGGQYRVKIETVAIGATRLPDWLVEFMLDNYVQPQYKIDLSKPQALPDHVVRIQLGSGLATFIRSPQKGQ